MALYDTTFKELAKTGLIELVRFLMPDVAAGVELCELPPEFPATVRSADFVFKTLGGPRGPRIGLFECQVAREDKLPRLLLLRAALAHYYYDLPVSTVLLALTREAVVPPSLVYGLCEEREQRHEFTVRRLYEEPAEPALERAPPPVLPLCSVLAPEDGDRAALLEKILLRIGRLPLTEERRTLLLQWATTFATLHLPAKRVTLLSEELVRRHPSMLQPLRDFPLLRNSFNEGKSEGKAEGKAEGIALSLMRVLEARGLVVPESVKQTIRTCTDCDRLTVWLTRAVSAPSLDDILV